MLIATVLAILGASVADSRADAQDASFPRQVFAVNTGAGTVSLVDLETMKEVEKSEVGPGPAGSP